MNKALQDLSELIAEANDLFYEKNSQLDTVIGIMDKTLRAQGMAAEAISIDCIPVHKKIVFLIHDAKPDHVDVAFGNKAGDISSANTVTLATLQVTDIVTYMSDYFAG